MALAETETEAEAEVAFHLKYLLFDSRRLESNLDRVIRKGEERWINLPHINYILAAMRSTVDTAWAAPHFYGFHTHILWQKFC